MAGCPETRRICQIIILPPTCAAGHPATVKINTARSCCVVPVSAAQRHQCVIPLTDNARHSLFKKPVLHGNLVTVLPILLHSGHIHQKKSGYRRPNLRTAGLAGVSLLQFGRTRELPEKVENLPATDAKTCFQVISKYKNTKNSSAAANSFRSALRTYRVCSAHTVRFNYLCCSLIRPRCKQGCR